MLGLEAEHDAELQLLSDMPIQPSSQPRMSQSATQPRGRLTTSQGLTMSSLQSNSRKLRQMSPASGKKGKMQVPRLQLGSRGLQMQLVSHSDCALLVPTVLS